MNLIEPKFKLLVYDKKQFKDKDEANNNIALIKNRITIKGRKHIVI